MFNMKKWEPWGNEYYSCILVIFIDFWRLFNMKYQVKQMETNYEVSMNSNLVWCTFFNTDISECFLFFNIFFWLESFLGTLLKSK